MPAAREWIFRFRDFRRCLPYMNIQKTLSGSILVPGGVVSLSLHLPRFTVDEFFHYAFPKPVPTLFRLNVMPNGLLFHCSGRTVGCLNGRTESFQTERGMRAALHRARLVNPSFRRGSRTSGRSIY